MRSVFDLLATLPGTADDIASHLLTLGCKGKLKSRCQCPIAILIEREGYSLIDVRRRGVYCYSRPDNIDREYPLSPAVQTFIFS